MSTTEAPLQITIQELGPTVVIKLAGMAAVEVAGQLSRSLQEAAAKKPRILAVDLSDLAFVSSTGLGGLVAAHVTCQRHKTQLVLVNPKPFIREVLNVTKLGALFKMVDTVHEAQQLAG